MAGVKLHEKIIEYTQTDGTDQSHFEVHHLSRSHDIVDRTAFLQGKIQENPAHGMYRTVEALYRSAQVVGKELVVGIPCNTFHAPRIFLPFQEKIKRAFPEVQLLHMLEETGLYMKEQYAHLKTIGLMTTTGTREVQVYRKILQPQGYQLTRVPKSTQAALNTTIYDPQWGLKAVSPVTAKARDRFLEYAKLLIEQGAEAIILGCTEIPLALPESTIDGIPLVDPVSVLAKALIREASSNVQ